MGSHAEQPRRESIGMKIIILLTVLTTLGFCQRLSPPSNPLTEPPAGQRCAGRNFNGRRCCTPEEPCGYGRETVTVPWTGEPMMVTEDVRENWCVEATTA